MDSPAVQNALKNLQEGERKRIAFKAEKHYPHYSATPITVFGFGVIVHEGLFHYLEKIHWLHPYTMVWWCDAEQTPDTSR